MPGIPGPGPYDGATGVAGGATRRRKARYPTTSSPKRTMGVQGTELVPRSVTRGAGAAGSLTREGALLVCGAGLSSLFVSRSTASGLAKSSSGDSVFAFASSLLASSSLPSAASSSEWTKCALALLGWSFSTFAIIASASDMRPPLAAS